MVVFHLEPGIFTPFYMASQFPLPEPNALGTCDNETIFLYRKGNGIRSVSIELSFAVGEECA